MNILKAFVGKRAISTESDIDAQISSELQILSNIKNAIESGNSDKLSEIIKEGNNIDINMLYNELDNKSMLMFACEKAYIGCVVVLLRKG